MAKSLENEVNLLWRWIIPTLLGGGVIFLVLSAGCAEDVANRYYATVHYQPKAVKDVTLMSRAPSRPYEVIADFQSRNESPEALREKAAKIGADAIIVTPLGGRYDPSEEWADPQHARNQYTRIVGSAIKYK